MLRFALQRGLFERHKLLFALMLTNKILVSAGKVKPQDVDILLKGGGALDITSVCMDLGRVAISNRKGYHETINVHVRRNKSCTNFVYACSMCLLQRRRQGKGWGRGLFADAAAVISIVP